MRYRREVPERVGLIYHRPHRRNWLLQLDGKIANVALMRLSAHLKACGESVEFRHAGNASTLDRVALETDLDDAVYASAIFERTRPLAERLLRWRPQAVVGGTGWDVASSLEAVGVTTTEQDYSIYPEWRQSIGFTQRGCRLRCAFCVVPRKEGPVREEQTVAELWRGDPWPRELILLDNDFFGQSRWADRIDEMLRGRFKVSFNQGINARMLTDETAAAIASVDYRDDQMRDRRIYTAWDSLKDERKLFAGLEALVKHGVRPRAIMVYILVGYWPGETHADRDHRRARLREFGALPYPMPYVRTPELIGFQRWCIRGYDRRGVTWAEFEGAGYDPRRLALERFGYGEAVRT